MADDNYIDLGRKPEKPTVASGKMDESPYYPTVMFSTTEPCPFPSGVFKADVEVKVKRSEASEDESGKKRYSYTLELRGIEPMEDDDDDSEDTDSDEGEEMGQNDAASSLMEAMQKARGAKQADMEDEE